MAGTSVCKIQRVENLEDQTSRLPDEVLAHILSLMTLKEAGRCSLLSKRWRGLWKLTTRLNFVVPKAQTKSMRASSKEVRDTERSKYVAWVNEVLRVHEGSPIDEFQITFDLDASDSDHIEEWIKFSMIRKRAKRIRICLTSDSKDDYYTISQGCYDYLKSVPNSSCLMSLRSLSVHQVNVDGGFLEYLLSKCPNLEMLFISYSKHLVKLKVAGPSVALKYLRINWCSSLERIELSSPKLETFIFLGSPVDFILGNNPLLKELNIGGGCEKKTVPYCLGLFSRHFSQLKSLTLGMLFTGDDSDIPQVPKLPLLEHLTLSLGLMLDISLIGFTRLLVAAPSLAKLSLVIMHLSARRQVGVEETLFQRHDCLKEVEVFGLDGFWGVFEMARYLIKSSVNLERVVIDPCGRSRLRPRKVTGQRAMQIKEDVAALKASLPPGAKLILNNMQ